MAGVRLLAVVVLVQWIQLTSGSCESGMFGDSCSYFCHCGTLCDETTGSCSNECDRGWRKAGGLCQKQNIAIDKTTSTTSGHHTSWYPSKAVDGDRDIHGESRTCFHADRSPSDWTVDLGRNFQLYDIRIYSRNGFYSRNANSTIYLNNDPSSICSTLPGQSNTSNPTDVTCNGTGRYVTIRKLGPGGQEGHDSALNICEVDIYVCGPRIFGVNCDTFCHCLNPTCDRLSGLCPGDCRPGWQGQRCDTGCKPGRYGPDCTRCGHCDVTCNIGDGRCPGQCLDGFTGDRCDEDVRVSPVTSGVIGGAVAVVIMLLLIGGLTICLLKSGRLKWISSPDTGVRNTNSGGTGEIPSHANTSGTNEQDYTELSEVTREREEKSQYDVIQNKVYENNQI